MKPPSRVARPAAPVLDGVPVQRDAFGSGLVAASALQEDQRGLAQASMVLVIGSKARQPGCPGFRCLA